jgi:hypothetical protein
MIKVMNLVALILAPLVVQTTTSDSTLTVLVVSLIGIGAIVLSVRRSDRDEEADVITEPISGD